MDLCWRGGDRRGFVVADTDGGIHALGKRLLGIGTKNVRDRLGDAQDLPDVEQAQKQIAAEMRMMTQRLDRELEEQRSRNQAKFDFRKASLIERQRTERKRAFEKIEARINSEAKARQGQFRKGLSGLWDRLRGEYQRIRQRNDQEALRAYQRDRLEKDKFVLTQLKQRQRFDDFRRRQEQRYADQKRDLRDWGRSFEASPSTRSSIKHTFNERRKSLHCPPTRDNSPSLD